MARWRIVPSARLPRDGVDLSYVVRDWFSLRWPDKHSVWTIKPTSEGWMYKLVIRVRWSNFILHWTESASILPIHGFRALVACSNASCPLIVVSLSTQCEVASPSTAGSKWLSSPNRSRVSDVMIRRPTTSSYRKGLYEFRLQRFHLKPTRILNHFAGSLFVMIT